jgi:hypothetical protein
MLAAIGQFETEIRAERQLDGIKIAAFNLENDQHSQINKSQSFARSVNWEY